MQLDVNVVLSEFDIIKLYIYIYIILKYFSDIGFACDDIRTTWDVKSKLARLVTLAPITI
jgi:hypothetical protein